MVAFVFSHKITTLPNFISAIKKNFEYQGVLPRGLLFFNVRKGLNQICCTFDTVIHKVPIRLKSLLRIISFFLSIGKTKFAFGVALNYWGALRISELLSLTWADLRFYSSYTAVIVRKAKNHKLPKISFVSHTEGVDSLVIRAAAVKPNIISDSAKVFSFSRKTFNKAIKFACSSLQIPSGTSHSFRAGFITDASAAGIPDSMIALHTRHKSIQSLQSCELPSISDLNGTSQLISQVSRV